MYVSIYVSELKYPCAINIQLQQQLSPEDSLWVHKIKVFPLYLLKSLISAGCLKHICNLLRSSALAKKQ